ncbi:MAG: hypothetical protein Q4D82_07620 [Neisseria sp.]|nr:hypothetical protein [Neisseria sp.]
MKLTPFFFSAVAALVLSACALTPEQQAAREAAARAEHQRLQVALAAQCSPEAAALMRRQFDGDTGADEQSRQAFRLAYAEKIGEPMFQACYRMAWQSYTAQQRADYLEYLRWRDDDWWYGPRRWWGFYRW